MDIRVRTACWRLPAIVAVVLGSLLLFTPQAMAHAELLETSPANGAHLGRAPREAVLRFSESVSPVRGGFSVLDGNGAIVAQPSATASGARVILPLPDSLGDGVYVVNWRVVSTDSHPIHGSFVFSVGTARAAPLGDPGAQSGSDSSVGGAFWLFRLLGYASLAMLIGGAFFLMVSWPAGRADHRARRLLAISWVSALVSAAGSLLLQGPYATGGSLADVADLTLVPDTLGTGYGILLLVRIVLLGVTAVLLPRLLGRVSKSPSAIAGPDAVPDATAETTKDQYSRRPGGDARNRTTEARFRPPAGAGSHRTGTPIHALAAEDPLLRKHVVTIGVLGVALAGTWSGTGHPAAAGGWIWAALPLDAAHLVAVSVWLGGLVILVACTLWRNSRAGEEEAAAAATRYSKSAAIAVVVLGATGLLQAARELIASGLGTEYFSLLVFKIGAFGLLIWLAALSRAAVRRQLSVPPGRKGSTRRAQQDMIGRLRLSVRWEVGIAVVVLGLTAALVATPPGGHDHGPGAVASAGAGPFLNALTLPAGSGDVQVWVDPARTGNNQIVLNVRDGRGINRDVPEVSAQLRLPAKNIGPLPVTLAKTGRGQFVADEVVVPVPGMWQLSLRVRSTDFDEATVDTQIEMR